MRARAWRRLAPLGQQEGGSVLPLMALSLATLLGFGALVTDVGFLYLQRRILQNAADAAALAAAPELPDTPGAAQRVALDYASRNGVSAPGDMVFVEIVTTFVTDDSIRVTATRSAPLFFAGVLGIGEGEVSASATAVTGMLGSTRGLLPFGVRNPTDLPGCVPLIEFCFDFGQLSTLKSGPGGQYLGNFQALAIDGPGADVYRRTIHSGSLTSVTAGSYVPTETGNLVGPTRQGLEDRLANNTQTFAQVVQPPADGSSYVILDPNSPRLVLIPIIQELVSPNEDVLVLGFGLFFVDDTEFQGNDTYLYGYFIDATLRAGDFAPLNVNYGTRKVRLIQ